MNTILTNIGLPNWPQMLVSGTQVSVDQAKEIIFRTNSFLTDMSDMAGGNNESFNNAYRRASGLEQLARHLESICTEDNKLKFSKLWDLQERFCSDLGIIETQYVRNNWASCCFAYGPHGWCHVDGKIAYVDNVGKWPSVEELLSDWTVLAKEFPFLDLNVTIMDGGSCENNTESVVNIRVCGGVASLGQPDLSVHCQESLDSIDRSETIFKKVTSNESYGIGLPHDWYIEFAIRIRTKIEESYGDQVVLPDYKSAEAMMSKIKKEEDLKKLNTLFELAIQINASGRLMKEAGVLIVDEQLALALCNEIDTHRVNPVVSEIIFVLAHDFRNKAKPCVEQGFLEIDYLLIASLLQEIAHLKFT